MMQMEQVEEVRNLRKALIAAAAQPDGAHELPIMVFTDGDDDGGSRPKPIITCDGSTVVLQQRRIRAFDITRWEKLLQDEYDMSPTSLSYEHDPADGSNRFTMVVPVRHSDAASKLRRHSSSSSSSGSGSGVGCCGGFSIFFVCLTILALAGVVIIRHNGL